MDHHSFGHGGFVGTRREFLSRCGMGMGALAMGSLPNLLQGEQGGISPLAPKPPQYPGKA
ncbi:MAG: twin-arginine translocation signal domain-containing protein, partial [Akkermansiaceae bacterium]